MSKSIIGMAFRDLPTITEEHKKQLIEKLDTLVRTNTPFIAWDEVADLRSGESALMRWINIGFQGPECQFRIKCIGKVISDRRKEPRDARLNNLYRKV